jgi:hypothetical protein
VEVSRVLVESAVSWWSLQCPVQSWYLETWPWLIKITFLLDNCDQLNWTSWGTAKNGFIAGLDLKLTSTSKKLYYLRVKARNGANVMSKPMTGKPLELVDKDKTGNISYQYIVVQ